MSDIGISAIERCKSRVTNPSTLVEGPRGFAVWHGPLRLTAWADAPFMVGEVEISRLQSIGSSRMKGRMLLPGL
ncbi:MAG: hypothetical protein HND42_06410 [Armatimonadetes bacterium]|nr:hypothetical protein [Armatimonadota bacterium]NOG92859.1 hypothetical protein [Armatimonadota bacterium]